jgi:hypothetical protein
MPDLLVICESRLQRQIISQTLLTKFRTWIGAYLLAILRMNSTKTVRNLGTDPQFIAISWRVAGMLRMHQLI